jgi:hypothetical protein
MKSQRLLICGALTLLSLVPMLVPAYAQTSSWEAPYAGADATGPNVVALWNFNEDAPGKDASSNGHDLTIRGKDTHYGPNGKFSGGLIVDGNIEPGDTRQGVQAESVPDLNPKGAFTVELWFSPDEKQTNSDIKDNFAFLIDKKYFNYAHNAPEANTGYMLGLRKSGEIFTVETHLGFGTESAIVSSEPQTLIAGEWYHFALTYNGTGSASLYLGNTRIGQIDLKNRGAVAASAYPLVIGDRVDRIGQRFRGRIDEVRILNTAARYVSGKVLMDASAGRTTFYRMEKDAGVQVSIFNDTLQTLSNASLHIKIGNSYSKTILVTELASDKSTVVTLPLDVTLRPDTYEATVSVHDSAKKSIGDAVRFPITIVPRALPDQIPVMLWGETDDYKQLTDVGYTGQLFGYGRRLVSPADYARIWENPNGIAKTSDADYGRARLDKMLASGVDGFAVVEPGTAATTLHPEFNRTDISGKKIENTNGLYPEIQKFNYNTGALVARTFGDMPGWKGSLVNTEVRDLSVLGFSDIDKKSYRDFSGKDFPSLVTSSRGITYKAVPDFPSNHIIADDDPILQFYKWFWKDGDGWNTLNSKVNDGLKSIDRANRFTWYDPAVRVPSLYGSGGNVDFINQWTYTYPDPLKVGLATDELFAMAAGNPAQQVMNMIQIIWYRSETTGEPIKGQETDWEKAWPKAPFISIAPDHLSEGTWLQLARPVQGLANHGWGSLGDNLEFSEGGYYVTTNVETRKRMTHLLQNVVKPLQPALKQVPDHPADVAFLQSFASQMFAGTGNYGWGGGWGADSYMIASYAGLQPQIVYDETIQQKGLSQYKVLFLMDCPVLTQSVADAIKKFQQNGGIVIGDNELTSGISPDILMLKATRTTPDATKALLIEKAAELRGELDTFYLRPLESSNPDVITRLRQFGRSQYVFTINDHRTYGDYVGQHRKVMEKGLPSEAQISLNTMSGGYVYDLMKQRQVSAARMEGKVQFPVRLQGGEGNVFLVMPNPVGKLQVTLPPTVRLQKSIPVKILLNDNTGKPLDAVVPLKVSIRDSKGRIAEKSGYYGAASGVLNLSLDIAPNDAQGKWQVEVSESLTGQQVTRNFEVL